MKTAVESTVFTWAMVVALLVVLLAVAVSEIDHQYVRGMENGREMVEYPAVREGRLRWTETDRDTLASGLIVTEIKDLVTQERHICVQAPDGSMMRLRQRDNPQ